MENLFETLANITNPNNGLVIKKTAVQKYATKVFYSKKNAIDFKEKLGENCKQTIKIDKIGRFKVRFLIDKSTIKYKK